MRTAGGWICRISSLNETPDKISLKTKRNRGQQNLTGKKSGKTLATILPTILMNLISNVNTNLVVCLSLVDGYKSFNWISHGWKSNPPFVRIIPHIVYSWIYGSIITISNYQSDRVQHAQYILTIQLNDFTAKLRLSIISLENQRFIFSFFYRLFFSDLGDACLVCQGSTRV